MSVINVDSSRVAICAIFIVVVGMETFIVQPGFVQGLVEYAGYSEQGAGYVASLEMFGIAASTIMLAPVAQRLNWRIVGAVSAVIVGGANLVSMAALGDSLFGVVRFLAGLGSGVLIAYGYAVIGMTSSPDRKFGYLITCVLIYGALGLLLMPAALPRVGMRGVLMFLAMLSAAALAALPFLPGRIADSAAAAGTSARTLTKRYRYMGLGAVFAFFLAQGAVWAYLFLIGLAAGVSERAVATGLTLAQLTGIAGALAAAALGPRMRHAYLLGIGVVLGIAPLLSLFGTAGALTYTVAVCVFNFSANLLTPLLMAVIAGFDATGRLVVYAVAAQMLALAAGPAIAALIIVSGNYDRPLLLCEALLAASLLLILPPVSARRRIDVLACLLTLAIAIHATSAAAHPLDALSADELDKTVRTLKAAKLLDTSARFGIIRLQEPEKHAVLAWHAGVDLDRMAYVNARQNRRLYRGIVDVTHGKVLQWDEVRDEQSSFLLEEILGSASIVKADAGWRAAMRRRGYVRYDDIVCNPLAAGYFGATTPRSERLMNVPCFDTRGADNNLYARPIEGLMAVVDLDQRKVLRLVDLGVVAVPADAPTHDYAKIDKFRGVAKPVRMTTPEGANFSLADGMVTWDNWRFHLRVDRRVGAVVSLIQYNDRGRMRQIAYQISPSEMFVPYMDPAPTWSFKGYMDIGEYGFGVLASPLLEGRDCPDDAVYLSTTLADDRGKAVAQERIVCIFERATADPVWRHFEVFNQTEQSRAETELVVRFIPTVGNYDYLIDYVFNQKGEIAVRVGATGIDAVKAVASEDLRSPSAKVDTAYGTLVAPHLVAVNHDHYINFRLDLDIDGQDNSMFEDSLQPIRLPPDDPRRSLWRVQSSQMMQEGAVTGDLHKTFWRIANPTHLSAMGYPTGYVIMPGHADQSMLSPDDPPQARAAFSAEQLWVTRYNPDELYAGGEYPNQSKGGEGLPRYVADRQSIVNTDLVLWYTVGFRHVPRAEDWPVMPTFFTGFMIRPQNFFDRNPALDVSPAPGGR